MCACGYGERSEGSTLARSLTIRIAPVPRGAVVLVFATLAAPADTGEPVWIFGEARNTVAVGLALDAATEVTNRLMVSAVFVP